MYRYEITVAVCGVFLFQITSLKDNTESGAYLVAQELAAAYPPKYHTIKISRVQLETTEHLN